MTEADAGPYATFLEHAIRIAREAGAIQLASLGKVERIEYKGRVDLVTEVDKRSEAAIVGYLEARFPEHRIVAEEGSGTRQGASPYQWFVDPLDGTTNYAHAFPYFAVAIALAEEDELIVGVVLDAVHDELFHATRGGGAFLNGVKIGVSATPDLRHGLVSTGFPYRAELSPRALAHWAAFTAAAQAVRRNGAAALDLCGVAAGRFDGFYEAHLGPWDCAAGALIVAEAGGTLSNYAGGKFSPLTGELVASNGRIHDAMLGTLAASWPEGPGSGDGRPV